MSLALYRALTTAAAPLIRVYLARRVRTGKEDPERLSERFGIASLPRPTGRLVWVHAASVGESVSMLSLIQRLRRDRPDLALLVTTGTVTSARIMAERLPAGVTHQYVPLDRAAWVRRFMDHWRPDAVLWVESEFWPNFLGEIGARRIPAALVNARISDASFAGWRRGRRTIRRLLANFEICLAQAEADRDRLVALGARDVRMAGNLKLAADALPVKSCALDGLRGALGARPLWLAASTHPGEEDVIADVHRRLSADHPGLVTVIVPRHVARGREIARSMARFGLNVRLRSEHDAPDDGTDIYIADTMGELGLFYRLAPVVFIGGSLVPHGGQNLLEAAKLGCAVIHGPHMENFRDIAGEMHAAGATVTADSADRIASEVGLLLADGARARQRAEAAAKVADGKTGILDAVMKELAPILLDPADTGKTTDSGHARA